MRSVSFFVRWSLMLAVCLVVAVSLGMVAPAALVLALSGSASAADPVIAQDTLVREVYELGGVTLYYRSGRGPKRQPERPWVRVASGHSRVAKHIPSRTRVGDIGRDWKGRIVLTFGIDRSRNGLVVGRQWWIYDVMSDRARRVQSLPGGSCIVEDLVVWRSRKAYNANCKSDKHSGIFLKTGTRIQRVTGRLTLTALVLRGSSLAGIIEDGVGDLHLTRFVDGGRKCFRPIANGFGVGEHDWAPGGVWLSGSYLVWTMSGLGDSVVLAAKRSGKCQTLGRIGLLPFKPMTSVVRDLTIDGRRLVYAGGRVIKAHTLPREPSFAPPPNDDFENAASLPASAPFTATGRIGWATRQAGEPALGGAKQTVWYAFRPATSGQVYVSAVEIAIGLSAPYGVFTGSSVGALTEIPPSTTSTPIMAEAGETYWIAVGSSHLKPNYRRFYINVTLSPPPY
jgi:hypothetical protein